jgi:hypothetical protein
MPHSAQQLGWELKKRLCTALAPVQHADWSREVRGQGRQPPGDRDRIMGDSKKRSEGTRSTRVAPGDRFVRSAEILGSVPGVWRVWRLVSLAGLPTHVRLVQEEPPHRTMTLSTVALLDKHLYRRLDPSTSTNSVVVGEDQRPRIIAVGQAPAAPSSQGRPGQNDSAPEEQVSSAPPNDATHDGSPDAEPVAPLRMRRAR